MFDICISPLNGNSKRLIGVMGLVVGLVPVMGFFFGWHQAACWKPSSAAPLQHRPRVPRRQQPDSAATAVGHGPAVLRRDPGLRESHSEKDLHSGWVFHIVSWYWGMKIIQLSTLGTSWYTRSFNYPLLVGISLLPLVDIVWGWYNTRTNHQPTKEYHMWSYIPTIYPHEMKNHHQLTMLHRL